MTDDNETGPAPPVRRRMLDDARLRHPPKPKDRITGDRPWWATVKPGEQTKEAERRLESMTATARRLGLVIGVKITE